MIRKDEWTSGELQVIYDLVNTIDWFAIARKLLPGRSDNAIRTKMSNLRAEAGIVPGMIGPRAMSSRDAIRAAAKAGSERLQEAIRALEAA